MKSKPRKPKRPKHWTAGLDENAVSDALAEAVVDAHDDDEQHTGLLALIEDEMKFPFKARVMGEEIVVTGMEWPEDDSFGLDLICKRSGGSFRVEARSVELLAPFPEGHLRLAAYLDWKKRM